MRTALSLSLLTGRPFRITKLRANRTKPGLRPQHLAAVKAAAELSQARVAGDHIGSRMLTFCPGDLAPRDAVYDIGTAGATALVLQTLHLPIALRAESAVRVSLLGGTFNPMAPSFPFLERTWVGTMRRIGLPITIGMPTAGFYPVGAGRLEAWIEPGRPRGLSLRERGPLKALRVTAGVANLPIGIAERMSARAEGVLAARGLSAEIDIVEWTTAARGTAIAISAEHEGFTATFVAHGERGKPAEVVAEEAVAELLDYEDSRGVVDLYTADQILLPLTLAEAPSVYTVTELSTHLRTNAATIGAFLDRAITLIEPRGDAPGRVEVG